MTRRGILAIWHDLDPARVDDFREWHTREHMPERLSVPGFLLGCRYESIADAPLVFNFYLTESPATLTSAPYLERLNNPTPWTTRSLPALQDVRRAVGHVVGSCGAGQGGAIATIRLNVLDQRRDEFQTWLTADGLAQLLRLNGVTATHLWQADNSASKLETVESRARGGNAAVLEWTVAIEGNDVKFVQAACDWLHQQQQFTDAISGESVAGFYRLQHRLGQE